MKKTELTNLRTKTVAELKKMASEKKDEASMDYAKIKAGQEKNVKKSYLARKELAQILTILREKEIIEKEKNEENLKGGK